MPVRVHSLPKNNQKVNFASTLVETILSFTLEAEHLLIRKLQREGS
jgi:hypothetical protein